MPRKNPEDFADQSGRLRIFEETGGENFTVLAHSIAKLAFDEQTLTLRIDLFNLTNRTNFGVPIACWSPGLPLAVDHPF